MASAVCAIAIGPVLFAFGIRDLPYLGAFVGLGFAMLITSILGVRRIAPRVTFAAFSIVVIAMIALTARMFSPFLIAPATASLTLAMGAFQPAARSRLVTLLLMVLVMIAILGVYAAEALGLVAPTMIQHGDWLYLHLRLEGASQFCMVSALCVFVIMVMPLASAGSYFSLRSARRSREQLQIQQWHLRQLIRH